MASCLRGSPLVLLLLVPFFACNSGSSSADGSGVTVRPSVVKIYAGHAYPNAGCTDFSAGDCPGFERVSVFDVEVVPPHVRVFRIYFGNHAGAIDSSDDMGKTWSTAVLQSDLQQLPINWPNAGPIGVHYEDGHTYLVANGVAPEIEEFGDMTTWEVDLATGALKKLPHAGVVHVPRSPSPVRFEDGHLRWYDTAVADYDPETDVLQYATPQNGKCGVECLNADVLASDGTFFDGYGWGDDWKGQSIQDPLGPQATVAMMCRVRMGEDGSLLDLCMPRKLWPETGSTMRASLLIRGDTAFHMWDDGKGNAYASAILPDDGVHSPVSTVSLGAGYADEPPPWGTFERRRFGPFAFVWDGPNVFDRQGHLVELTPTGARRAMFDVHPCPDSAGSCGFEGSIDWGYAQVQWIEPTGEGDYFVFYSVQTLESGHQETLYVERQTPTYEDYPQTGIPQITGDWPYAVRAYPHAEPMTTIESQCVVYASCVAGDPGSAYRTCLEHFAVISNASVSGVRAARDRFTAAPHTCDGIKSVWPEAFGVQTDCPLLCFELGGTCDASTPCSVAIGPAGASCGTCIPDSVGPGSDYVVCLDGVAYKTPQGTCTPNVGLTGCPSSGCSPDGSTLTTCDSTTNLRSVEDCADFGYWGSGRGCDAGACASKKECDPAQYGTKCSTVAAGYLSACSEGTVKYVSCKSLGFSTCVNGACK